jgi:hypothetical protein
MTLDKDNLLDGNLWFNRYIARERLSFLTYLDNKNYGGRGSDLVRRNHYERI